MIRKFYSRDELGFPYGFFWGFSGVLLFFKHYYIVSLVMIVPLWPHRGLQCGILIALGNLWALTQLPQWLEGQLLYCDKSKCILESVLFRHVPIRESRCPEGVVCKIETATLSYSSRGDPFIKVTHCHSVHVNPLRSWLSPQLSPLTQDLLSTVGLGSSRSHSEWRDLWGSLGLGHLLCFSGWHAYKIWDAVGRNRILFSFFGGAYLWVLSAPFSFLCAYLKILAKAFLPPKAWPMLWPSVLIIGPILCPFCWLNLGTWLSLYYMSMIELTGFCSNRMRLSGLGWAAFLGQEIEIIPWVAGIVIERYFGLIIFCVTLGIMGHIIWPFTIPFLNTIAQGCFPVFSYLRKVPFSFSIPEGLSPILLCIPFFIEPSGTVVFYRSVFLSPSSRKAAVPQLSYS